MRLEQHQEEKPPEPDREIQMPEIKIEAALEQQENEENFVDAESSLTPATRTTQITKGWCAIEPTNVVDKRLRNQQSQIAMAMMSIDEGPGSYEEAITSQEKASWMEAMTEELKSLQRNGTWELVAAPKSQKVIDNKWVFKIKRKASGEVDRYKARLVVRGFTQEYGVDYQETFSPVVKFTSIRSILSIAVRDNLILKQFDVKTAFLYGDLCEQIFMKQPAGFDDGSGRVCKLVKSLYGLKQASRCWNQKFSTFLNNFKFIACSADQCVFVCGDGAERIILAIYVDDGLIAASTESKIKPVIDYLRNHFEIKLSDADYFLGLELTKQNSGGIILHQTSYAKKILHRYNMGECIGVSTPADINQTIDDAPDSTSTTFPYREAVGSLLYLAVATRPDISFAVGMVSRYLDKPTKSHVFAVKRILKYVKATYNYGIKYDLHQTTTIDGYSDADYAGDRQTRRSTSGYVFFLGSNLVSWCSERQKSVALSTTESEYIAACSGLKELIWLQQLLRGLTGEKLQTNFMMDNQSAIRLIKNPEFHKRTKHIDVRYHFIREKYEEGFFNLLYVPTDEQRADIFTKALAKGRFTIMRELLNIIANI